MRRVCTLTSFLGAVCLMLGGSAVWAQVVDDFEGTYVTQSAPNNKYDGPVAPGWIAWDDSWSSTDSAYDETAGRSSVSAQRIQTPSGSGGLAKQFTVTPGKYIRVKIWIKTSNIAGDSQATGWVEYGYDVTGQTSNPVGPLWHDDEPDSPKNNLATSFNTWTQYQMPDLEVVQATGATVSVWLKAGAGGSMRADFDDLEIEELDVPPGTVTPEDFPDDFEGTYEFGVAPGWFVASLPGGTGTANREEVVPGRGDTGSAQRMYTLDRKMGLVKLFNAPTLTNLRLSVWVRTANSDGTAAYNPSNGNIQFGYDPTGQLLDMGAETIVWDDSIDEAGATPFNTWTQFTSAPFLLGAGESPISVWLRVDGGFSTPGARADFDDLGVLEGSVISGTEGWELYR